VVEVAAILVALVLVGVSDAGAAGVKGAAPAAVAGGPGLVSAAPSGEEPGAVASPILRLSPTVGPPGTVITVTGRLMPANMMLRLSWSVGVQPTNADVFTSDGGSFTTQILILPGDGFDGPRDLYASVPFGLVSLGAVVPNAIAKAPFLVTERSAQPPAPDAAQNLWGYLPFFFRR
jgi:hypothetical protein